MSITVLDTFQVKMCVAEELLQKGTQLSGISVNLDEQVRDGLVLRCHRSMFSLVCSDSQKYTPKNSILTPKMYKVYHKIQIRCLSHKICYYIVLILKIPCKFYELTVCKSLNYRLTLYLST